jgi:phosphatidylglycerophosphate synthase
MVFPDRGGVRSHLVAPFFSGVKQLPNIISLIRLAGTSPLLVGAMIAGSRPWFFGLLCVAWFTDALDGWLARRLHAESEVGRMLDSWADYVTAALCVAGLAWLWPEIMAREWLWFAAGVTGYFAIVVHGLVRYGRPPGFHTWAAKGLAVALPVAIVSLITNWSAIPFHVVVVLQAFATLEEVAILLLLPGYSGAMPSAWHAWRRRRAAEPGPG